MEHTATTNHQCPPCEAFYTHTAASPVSIAEPVLGWDLGDLDWAIECIEQWASIHLDRVSIDQGELQEPASLFRDVSVYLRRRLLASIKKQRTEDRCAMFDRADREISRARRLRSRLLYFSDRDEFERENGGLHYKLTEDDKQGIRTYLLILRQLEKAIERIYNEYQELCYLLKISSTRGIILSDYKRMVFLEDELCILLCDRVTSRGWSREGGDKEEREEREEEEEEEEEEEDVCPDLLTDVGSELPLSDRI
ncbi:hypothetical protein LZ554_008569 [Drepanopeziza brunnea f. sp. 'monogermtubi']|nr:hypothetical protein LZ554_008569 [Drepanopeziza brunnea f. sp. 'monogermtubi']